jgi:type I restriction enzyme S subunit
MSQEALRFVSEAAGNGTNGGASFDAESFLEHFELLAQSDGGIKRLREIVLSLAVRGALVRQDPADGTSDALLARIAKARDDNKATRREELPPLSPEECPFEVPAQWRWARLGAFGGMLGGGTPTKSNPAFWKGKIPWVSPKDMKRAYIDDAEDHISPAAIEDSAAKLIPSGSLLFVVRGMILAHSFPVALTTREVTINQDMKALVPVVPETREFLLRACWAARPRVLARVERSSHGTCRLGTEVVEQLAIPVPPLAEQARIVKKADSLMAMLDELSVKQSRTKELASKLVDAFGAAIGA